MALPLLLCSPAFAYKITLTLAFPKGSAAEKLTTVQPSSTKFTPCTVGKSDAIQVTIAYDAKSATTGKADRDVYIIFYNPENDPRYILIRQPRLSIGQQGLIGFSRFADMDTGPTRDVFTYLPREQNLAGTGSEVLLSSSLSLDGLLTGTWQIIGIVADRASAKFSFNDPTTWDAWDVATVVVGRPWLGNEVGKVCDY